MDTSQNFHPGWFGLASDFTISQIYFGEYSQNDIPVSVIEYFYRGAISINSLISYSGIDTFEPTTHSFKDSLKLASPIQFTSFGTDQSKGETVTILTELQHNFFLQKSLQLNYQLYDQNNLSANKLNFSFNWKSNNNPESRTLQITDYKNTSNILKECSMTARLKNDSVHRERWIISIHISKNTYYSETASSLPTGYRLRIDVYDSNSQECTTEAYLQGFELTATKKYYLNLDYSETNNNSGLANLQLSNLKTFYGGSIMAQINPTKKIYQNIDPMKDLLTIRFNGIADKTTLQAKHASKSLFRYETSLKKINLFGHSKNSGNLEYLSCPEGFYFKNKTGSDDGECKICPEGCLNCWDDVVSSTQKCSKCHENMFLNLQDGLCLFNCPQVGNSPHLGLAGDYSQQMCTPCSDSSCKIRSEIYMLTNTRFGMPQSSR